MGSDETLLSLDAVTLRDRIAGGALKALDLAEACIARVEALDSTVQAWSWFDAEFVRHQARALDSLRLSGRPLGALHGIPVAVKDIIDTARIPTENGTAFDSGRVPEQDAAVVRQLKAAGAIIMGKTVTAELAYLHPGKTRNPVNPDHTPGGSSSGSAAAVAAGMVPLAVGTQTGGSVIRPAAFCGTIGYKASFGAIPRTGILTQSPSLDTVGVFARSVEDAAMLADVLFGHDPLDRDTVPAPHPRLLHLARSHAPVKPTFALLKTPFWERADGQSRAAIEELAGLLGEHCFEAVLPNAFADAPAIRERINLAEMAKCYYRYEQRGSSSLSPTIAAALATGNAISARDYLAALDWREVLYAGLGEIFDRCDAILTLSAPGPAPAGLQSTGDSIFNGLWTLCGTPAITLPVFEAENGLPMGVQLVGRRGDDGRLLRTARWLSEYISTSGEDN